MNVPLVHQVITEMETCQTFNPLSPGSWTRWIGMLRKAGEGAQTVSKFRIYPCGCAGQGDQEWPCDQHRKPSTPLAASSARADVETCGVVGEPEAGRCVCELLKGHVGYHRQGPVEWLGYHSSARAGSETPDDPLKEVWSMIEHGWDIEDRAYFEREAIPMGFKHPLSMAVHHMWKRRVKDEADPSRLASVPAVAAPSVGAAPQQDVALTLAVLKNLGFDTDCGACMEIGFTGVTTNEHTCKTPREPIVVTFERIEDTSATFERVSVEEVERGLGADVEKPTAPPEYGWSNGKPPDMDALVAEWLRVNQKGDGRGVYWSDFPLGVVRSLLERIQKQEAIAGVRGAALDAPEQP